MKNTQNIEPQGEIEFPEFVKRLCKPGAVICEELTPHDCNLLHMALGVSGEAGEVLDAVKKAVIYRKPLDRENIIEEAGDILFYLTGLLSAVGSSTKEAIRLNREKLRLRYVSQCYSDHDAQTRADKATAPAPITAPATAPDIEADLDPTPIKRACAIDDPECESCQ